MIHRTPFAIAWGVAWLLCAAAAGAYPGGTPGYQTDAAPYCASCHASRDLSVLEGAGPRATKELAANKHYAVIESGKGGYGDLSEGERAQLIAHLQKLDENTRVTLKAPEAVRPGETFEVTVETTGGAGPVIGVGLVDRAHRWLARPAPSAGWQVASAPEITGQDFKEQDRWLARRPESAGRNLAFVNVTGIASDASKDEWGRARVVWTLRAPARPGSYPLAAALWYGSEKASPLGYTEDPIRGKQVRGGFGGASGRILFTPVSRITVE